MATTYGEERNNRECYFLSREEGTREGIS